jgi:hypothetical protein
VAASHVHLFSKGSFDAFSGTVLFAVVLGMRALPTVDLPKDGQATSQSLPAVAALLQKKTVCELVEEDKDHVNLVTTSLAGDVCRQPYVVFGSV